MDTIVRSRENCDQNSLLLLFVVHNELDLGSQDSVLNLKSNKSCRLSLLSFLFLRTCTSYIFPDLFVTDTITDCWKSVRIRSTTQIGPNKYRHAFSSRAVLNTFQKVLPNRSIVRVQSPIPCRLHTHLQCPHLVKHTIRFIQLLPQLMLDSAQLGLLRSTTLKLPYLQVHN